VVGAFLVLKWSISIHGFTRLITTWTWGKPPPSPLVFFVISHGGCIQVSFCLGTPKLGVLKISKLGLLALWRAIMSCVDLWLRWGLKQNYKPCQELFNDMLHTTCLHVFEGDSWLLMDKSEIGTLTPDPFFGHNLCFKYSNGSCEPILNIMFQELSNGIKKLF